MKSLPADLTYTHDQRGTAVAYYLNRNGKAVSVSIDQVKGFCLAAARKCSSMGEFRQKYPRLSSVAGRHGWLGECKELLAQKPPPMPKRFKVTLEEIIAEARTFSSIRDWRKHGKHYRRAVKLGCLYEATCHMQ